MFKSVLSMTLFCVSLCLAQRTPVFILRCICNNLTNGRSLVQVALDAPKTHVRESDIPAHSVLTRVVQSMLALVNARSASGSAYFVDALLPTIYLWWKM